VKVAKPPESYTAPVAYPAIPDGAAPCPDAPEKRCLTDGQSAGLLADVADSLDAANAKLLRLRVWFDELPE